MNDSKIAVRYAKALFEITLSHKALEAVYEDMKMINQLCSLQEVKEIIENPVIPVTKKKEIMLALTGKGQNKLTVTFVDFIFSQGRGAHLNAVSRNFISLTRRHRGIRQVTLTTAVTVGEKVKEELAAIAAGDTGATSEFIEKIDPSIIGGFILRVDDTYIDASVKNRLNKFRKEFTLAVNAEE
ncbi:MAG: ATP synthase F1 subunit delta [Bacteroidales bacterium]|jgi:F-type H+-transporting ATPase subunit delta|nr:ATP synthase F1 subunit delta [Bacteroidales bacterium]